MARSAALRIALALLSFASAPAIAAELNVKVQIPSLDVAEYHRPYVAMWIEGPGQNIAANLTVWYQTDRKKEDGTQWLKDLRQWWRRGGRDLTMPVDGVTGATRPVGEHQLTFKDSAQPLATLSPGQYSLVVEAVREVGGRELLKVPFEWPIKSKQHASAQGKNELGAVTLDLIP